MNHEKFIESLNLYLDGALPAQEAAALERELATNPARRRIYRQYCQMQNACTELAGRYREHAAPAPHFRKGRVIELRRSTKGDWWRSAALVFSGAMAACAVFVVVSRINAPVAPSTIAHAPAASGALTNTQAVPTTTVAFEPSSAGFSNPWAHTTPVVLGLKLAPTTLQTPALLEPPSLSLQVLPHSGLLDEAAGKPSLPAMLPLDEGESTAFQFQR